MNNSLDDIALIYRVAKKYYSGLCTQEEIARSENISRPQISRILKKAREMGIVQIEVKLPDSMGSSALSSSIREFYGIQKVIISPVGISPEDTQNKLWETAAAYLNTALNDYERIGIGSGRTLFNISLLTRAQTESHRNMCFFPLMGNSITNNPYLQTTTIMDRFVIKYGAKGFYSSVPLVYSRGSASPSDLKKLQELDENWQSLDALIFTVGRRGSTRKSYFREELPENVYSEAMVKRVRFDILQNFYTDELELLRLPEDYAVAAIPLRYLSRAENSVCVCSGEDRVDALLFAIKNRCVSTLIADARTAQLLLEKQFD